MNLNERSFGHALKLHGINMLLVVKRCGSMGKAAAELSLSQPAISKAISEMERILGVRLLERGPRGVEPTIYGRALLDHGLIALDELRQAMKRIEFLANPSKGEVHIGSSVPIASGLVAAAVERLARRYPDIVFHISAAESGVVYSLLEERPEEHFYRYFDDEHLPTPLFYDRSERPDHPFIRDYVKSFNFDDYFEDQAAVRRAVAGYFGLCSFMDEQAGKVLDALSASGLAAKTRVIYTSDHGDAVGKRGLWGKSTLYEETCGVPLIVVGEGLPSKEVVETPANLIDIYPFIIECVGGESGMIDADHPGVSIARLAHGEQPDRTVLSEYHGMGSTTGAFAIRYGQFKYVHYVKYAPQLFHLANDPDEATDLAADPTYASIRNSCEARLRAMLSPEDIDARAKKRQAEQLQRYGGREAVIARGDLGFSPPPGVGAEFQ